MAFSFVSAYISRCVAFVCVCVCVYVVNGLFCWWKNDVDVEEGDDEDTEKKIKPMDSIKSLTALARLFLGLLEFGYSASLFSHSRLQFLNILE